MPKQSVSLREIARRLDIPPSTIVYYKDRFQRFIPHAGGPGRRRTYPPEALELFREIRVMYENNWTTEQIEENLAARRSGILPTVVEPAADMESPELVRSLTGLLDRMSGMLEDQAEQKTQIDALKDEVAVLRRERDDLKAMHRDKADELHRELAALRADNERMERYIKAKVERDNVLHGKPSKSFLSLPLVIRNGQGEYLGVSDKARRPFSLQNLITLVQRNTNAAKSVDMRWEREGQCWVLYIRAKDLGADDRGSGREQNLILSASQTVTPSRNVVARLTRMSVDGNTVPDPFLLSLFKQIRDSFEE